MLCFYLMPVDAQPCVLTSLSCAGHAVVGWRVAVVRVRTAVRPYLCFSRVGSCVALGLWTRCGASVSVCRASRCGALACCCWSWTHSRASLPMLFAGGLLCCRQSNSVLRPYPTLPSNDIANSFCASTANSIGSLFSTSFAYPFTIMLMACSVSKPRCRQ